MDIYGIASLTFRGVIEPTLESRLQDNRLPQGPMAPPLEALPFYSSSRPTNDSRTIRKEPEFFRLVVPAVHAGLMGGDVKRFADSPALREQCNDALKEALTTFSPMASLARAEPIEAPHMPLVHEALRDFPADHFAGHALIAVQHLFASTVGLIDALASKGLKHENMTVVGKSYSTCFGAARALINRGVNVPPDPLEQSAAEHHDPIMETVVRRELQRYREGRANGTAPQRLLALDEGGHIVGLLHTEFRDLLPYVTAVEQTTRGIRKAEALPSLGCTLVDVARADLKLDNEMQLDAVSLYQETVRKRVHLMRCGFKVPREISILGLGKLGGPTAAYFAQRNWKVRAYDIDPNVVVPPNVTLIHDREAFFRGAKVLMPITGQKPMTADDYDLLPHRALVMNGASSNDEVAAYDAIAKARREQPPRAWWMSDIADKASYVAGMPDLLADREYVLPSTGWIWGELDNKIIPLGHAARRAQRDRVLHFADKDIYLAKSGFVLNLTDDEDPIPPEFIQVTRAALALACAQAVANPGQGRMQLDPVRSRHLHKVFRRIAGDPAEASWTPTWRQTLPATKAWSDLLRGDPTNNEPSDEFAAATREGKVYFRNGRLNVRVRLSPNHVLDDLGEPGPANEKSAPSGRSLSLSVIA